MVGDAVAAGGSATRVFLSYSRKDSDFLGTLAAALETRGYAPLFDQSERPHADPDLQLTAQDEWWLQLKAMIAASDVMVFVVTPDSAASRVCDDEIAHAKSLGKRVIGILRRSINIGAAPERLRALNIRIDFSEKTDVEASLDALCRELDLDLGWHRQGARIARLAQQWDADGRPEGQLMRTGAIANADAWATRRPASAPELGELVLSFLEASREKERADRERLLTITGRAFLKPAEQALAEGRWDAALRYAAAGAVLGEDEDMRLVPERAISAAQAAFLNPLRAVLAGHTRAIVGLSVSRCGTFVLTSSRDGSARVWNARDGRPLTILEPPGAMSVATFNPDASRVATAGEGGKIWIWIWDWERGRPDPAFNADNGITDRIAYIEYSADGERLVVSGENGARVLDARSGREISRFSYIGDVPFSFFSPNGARVVSLTQAGAGSTAVLWDASDGGRLITLDHPDVSHAAFSPDGARIITAAADGSIRLWSADGIEAAVLAAHEGPVCVLCTSQDGSLLASGGSDGAVRVWSLPAGEERAKLTGHTDEVWSLCFSADGARLVSGGEDGTICVWDLPQQRRVCRLIGGGARVEIARFVSDDRIATASKSASDREPRIWDAAGDNRIVRSINLGDDGDGAAFGPDGLRLVAGVGGHRARIFSLAADGEDYDLEGHGWNVQSVGFSPAGDKIVTGSGDGTARVWESATGRCLLTLSGHRESEDSNGVRCAGFSPDGRWIVTGSLDKTARIWDAADGREQRLLKHDDFVHDAAFSPDGQLVATASGALNLWSGSKRSELQGQDAGCTSVAFTPDGAYLASGGLDGTIRFWRCEDQQQVRVLRHGERAVTSVRISPDGRRLVSTGWDGTARIWDIRIAFREIACLGGMTAPVTTAAFGLDGDMLATRSGGGALTLWDVRHTPALIGEPCCVIAAGTSHSRGRQTSAEKAELLMQAAPEDLHEALLRRLSPAQQERVPLQTEILAKTLYAGCYRPALAPAAASADSHPRKALSLIFDALDENDLAVAEPAAAKRETVRAGARPTTAASHASPSASAKGRPAARTFYRSLMIFLMMLALLLIGVAIGALWRSR